jgi:hypothetical protein
LLGQKDLGHAASGNTPDQYVLAEPNACVGWHLSSIILLTGPALALADLQPFVGTPGPGSPLPQWDRGGA